MSTISIPIERFLFGNEHWRLNRAIDEIEIYCDLIENLQHRIDTLETHNEVEEVRLTNVQAVISSYAFEIAVKSLWALDHPGQKVYKTHNLLRFFKELEEETVKELELLHLTRKVFEAVPEPFVCNRYSMECRNRDISVFPSRTLRPLVRLLRNKLEASRWAPFEPQQPSGSCDDV